MIAATIQARMGSERLPGKVLKTVLGKPLLAYMIERLKCIQQLNKIIVVTTIHAIDDPIVSLANELGVSYYRGNENNVLSRVLSAAQAHKVDVILQTTGDCPLIDPIESEKVLTKFLQNDYDLVSNVLIRTYPRGMESQVFSRNTLEKINKLTQEPIYQEHVSNFIYTHPERFKLGIVTSDAILQKPWLRLTVDTQEDFALIKIMIEKLYPSNPQFNLEDILALLDQNPEHYKINAHVHQKVTSEACHPEPYKCHSE